MVPLSYFRTVSFNKKSVDIYCNRNIHWPRLVKSIGWANPHFFGREMW